MLGSEKIILGGGCFWCIEAVFAQVAGVISAVSGYAGGTDPNPTYESVTSGKTGHAEVVEIVFDPQKVSLEQLLDLFFLIHDPTTPNRQGADIGTQYRSAIYWTDDSQLETIEMAVRQLAVSGVHQQRPIVTEIAPLQIFHQAEDYHQRYFERNPQAAYCQFVIRPKMDKLRNWQERKDQ